MRTEKRKSIKSGGAVASVTERTKVLVTGAKIQERIREMGLRIRKDSPDEPLLLVGVLKGAVLFLADLARQIPGEVTFDFIAVSSYGKDARSSGQVKLNKDLDSSIEGKTVIVVEDILDTGLTLRYLLRILQQRKPKNLRVAVLLDKVERKMTEKISTRFVEYRSCVKTLETGIYIQLYHDERSLKLFEGNV